MGGWGEAKGPSAMMVAQAEERRKAQKLARVTESYLRRECSEDALQRALDEYRKAELNLALA